MKNKNLLIGIGSLVLIAAGAAYLFMNRGGSEVMETVMDEQPFSGSLRAAAAMGVPMKCSYSVDGVEYEGYIKGQNYMGKFAPEGKTMGVILKDNCMWSWDEGSSSGVKTCFEPNDEESGSIWDSQDNPEMSDLNYTYTCRPAAFGDDTFEAPANIKFIDMQEMMKGEMGMDQMQDYLKQLESQQ